MSAEPTPQRDDDSLVERVRAQRAADGQPEFITSPGVYRLLDGIMAGRDATADQKADQKADRRRRAVERSRNRVPYQ